MCYTEQREWGRKWNMKRKLSERKIKKELGKGSLFTEIKVYDELDSTNRYVKEQAEKGAPEGLVVFAEKQSMGRGRLGRRFFSPEQKGIYMSVLLRPEIGWEESVRITSMVAVAVAEAIEKVGKIPTQIKWVNDIFMNRKKTCGILVESGADMQKGTLSYAVVGIGINTGKIKFPEELQEIATSIGNECGTEINRNLLAAEVLHSLEKWYPTIRDGKFLEESRRRSIVLGKQIFVHESEGNVYEATALELDDMGHLLVKKGEDKILLHSGEVSVRL